jgi:hypothetical protein
MGNRTYRTEEQRDERGNIVSVNVIVTDDWGRPVVQNVPASVAVGVPLDTVVAAVAQQVKDGVRTKQIASGGAPLTASQTKSIAQSKGSKVK